MDPRSSLAKQGFSRPTTGRVLGGVCAGIARRFGASTFLVRLGFVVSIVLPGPQILLYAALWILMPAER